MDACDASAPLVLFARVSPVRPVSMNQPLVDRIRLAARIDVAPPHRPPSPARVVGATLASVVGSLLADAVLVKIGTSLFPSTKGFAHFRPLDYGLLTVIGVLAAGAGWAVVTRVSSTPRWLFARLAVLVTIVLWIPDGWLFLKGEPPKAVAILMLMHVAIAIVTYNLLVRLAPIRPVADDADAAASPAVEAAEPTPPVGQAFWTAMAIGVGLELVLGVAGLVYVPLGRPSQLIPMRGEAVYLAHAVVGAALGVGGALLLARVRGGERLTRIGAVIGAIGLLLGLVGGLLAVYHSTRLAGMGLMLVGSVTAGFGYLVPVIA